ncbi:MAG: hypothetical protein ACP5NC_06070 [Nitrososphaeria archaeon]
MLDYAVVTSAIVLMSVLYMWVFEPTHYLKSNLGMPFIAAFAATLLASAALLFINQRSAYALSEYAYYLLLIGVIMQAVSYVKEKNGDGLS